MSKCFMLIGLAVLFAVGPVGCSKDKGTESEADPGGDIMPLAVENRWDYRVYVFPESGSPFDYLDSILILGTDTTDNVISYVANGLDLFLNRHNGLWYLPASGGEWSLLMKYPANVDDVWTTGGYGEFAMSLLSKSATVQTPYGDYTCYKYVREYRYGGRGAAYFYLVPQVGIVQYEYLDTTNTRIEEQGQLTNLHLVQ